MALWHKKEEAPPLFKELDFNIKKLVDQLNKLSRPLYEVRDHEGYKVVREILETFKNIKILQGSSPKTTDELMNHLGAVQMINEVLTTLDRMIFDVQNRDAKGKPQQKRKYVDNSNTQSGIADF